MSTLTLLCYARGDKYKQAFEVEIGTNKSIAALKKLVKQKKSATFHDVDAGSISLWRVSIPCDRGLEAKVEDLTLIDDNSLEPAAVISEVFSDGLENKHVHVVVERPDPGG